MPEKDGYELIRAVRALEGDQAGRLPALALSAHTLPEDRRRALASGFQIYLSKLAEPSELIAIVANLLESQRKDAA